MKHNITTNAGKHPYLRFDLWATGHFDFLLERNYGDKFKRSIEKRIEQSKRQYAKFKKQIDNHYPNERK